MYAEWETWVGAGVFFSPFSSPFSICPIGNHSCMSSVYLVAVSLQNVWFCVYAAFPKRHCVLCLTLFLAFFAQCCMFQGHWLCARLSSASPAESPTQSQGRTPTQSQSCLPAPYPQMTRPEDGYENLPQKIYPGEELPGCGRLRQSLAKEHQLAPMSSSMESNSPNALGLVILLLSFDLSCSPPLGFKALHPAVFSSLILPFPFRS